MWYALQCSIMFAVVASNIHWQWTPNPYLAAVAGWLAALIVTGFIVGRIEAARKVSITVVIFCWHILLISESMDHHDSEIMDDRSID